MHKLENKAKGRCQLGYKAMKIKVTNILSLKKRKNRYTKLSKGR